MSDDCCVDTGCSVDTGGDSGICSDATTCVETVFSGHEIDSAANDGIPDHHNVSFHSPVSIDDAGIQTISDGSTSRTKKSGHKAANCLPCVRIVVFILVIIVLLLICKMIICF